VISVLIPTRNEQQDLPACLQSVAWSDDVHVYDSFSTDRTLDIARDFGAHVVRREGQLPGLPFGGDESVHRNWALRNIRFKYPWVFHLDADERVTPDLRHQLESAVSAPGTCRAFRIRRRDFLHGTWLKHVQATPFYIRLFRPDSTRYERLINPVTIVDGPVGELSGYLDHYPFSKGFSHWVEKHNHYSTLEAKEIVENRRGQLRPVRWADLLSGDPGKRRACQKELFYRLPARPMGKFMLLYVAKRGFLDGQAGLTYACLQSMYEYLIVLKTKELLATAP